MNHLHFIGIGGIGMSGLAAMCRDHGMRVTGSDRGADRPENARIIDALRNQKIEIFPQDGSFIAAGRPDAIVYSTAIEEDNPDWTAAGGIPRLHRSELLEHMLETCGFGTTIAVTGSCGKSTVTAYLAEALTNLGLDPCCLNGALSNRFHSGRFAGNYRSGSREYFVFEADESDRSLLHYSPDYALVLNIGTDHYDREELARVFAGFLGRVRRGAVLERGVYEAVREKIPPHLDVRVFDAKPRRDSRYAVTDYRKVERPEAIYTHGRRSELAPTGDRAVDDLYGANNALSIYGLRSEDFRIASTEFLAEFNGEKHLVLPQPGFHTALNALAVYAMLDLLGVGTDEERLASLERFDGVWRRNDFAGITPKGTPVYDDYAHNPEKILSCLSAMRELAPGRIYAVFQPHGYKPFGFMRDELFERLDGFLTRRDRFILLEPFYAGGTSSFSPSAQEVAADWKSRSRSPERFMVFPDRETLADFLTLKPGAGDVIVIMGARDNSLSDYAKSLTREIAAP
ncbi:Mur ligase domain-containing protein [uncultured Victivallis sp.]|uniref:glutamate ligase domain-containing protein n=1 Tax=uncultured Victivallis sp. TaxID=354118 RepID=UPI0025DA0C78|nr:Mur ligase domain-containing protein [uncultured Victivallis sp.]